MATREEKSYCRICSGLCGMVVTMDEKEEIVGIRGDKEPIRDDRRSFAKEKEVQEGKGWQGSREHPATADEIAAHIDQILDTTRGFHIANSLIDEYRIVATQPTPAL